MQPAQPIPRQVIAFAIVSLICVISICVYVALSNGFAAIASPASYRPPITNGYILESQLPSSVYTYTTARIYDYLRANNLSVSSASITGRLTTSPDTYNFTLKLTPADQTLPVTIKVTNFSPILSTAVVIDGQLQNPLPPDTQSDLQINGMDSLTSAGITALQANSIQSAFQKFAPSANAITIDTASISHPPVDPNSSDPTLVYAFSVKVDNNSYRASLRCPSLSSVQLVLTNQAGKQVFDSGVVTSD